MILVNDENYKRTSDFLLEYVEPVKEDNGSMINGMLVVKAMKQAVKMMLVENVFTSKDEMKLFAMRDHKAKLPNFIFKCG